MYYSTAVGSTLITSFLNGTIAWINNGYYSTLSGSTITTSTFFGSTIGFSTTVGSTLTTSVLTVQSTLLGSTINSINIGYSTLTGSTMYANTFLFTSTTIGSTINVINTTYSTLSGSTSITNTGFWNSTLIGSTLTTTLMNYSTIQGSTIFTNGTNTNSLIVNSTLAGSTINTVNIGFSSLMGSTITTSTINAATLLTISSGFVGIGLTNPSYALQTAPQNSVNLSNSFLATWITLPTDVFQSFTAITNGTLTGSAGVNGIFTIGNYSSGEVLLNPNLIPGTVYRMIFTVSMTGVSPSFYLFNHVTGDSIIGSPTSITNTPATYTITFTAPSGKIGIAFTYSGAIVNGNVATWTGFTLQGFYNQSPGGVGIGTTNPQYSLQVANGSIQAYNLQQFEWINTQSSNTLGYATASGPGLYKIATLGATGNGGSFGIVNVRGQMGGFINNNVMYIDLSITTRGGLTVYGTVSGAYAAASAICDLIYSINTSSQYDIYIYIKSATYVVYDLMVSGASGSNILYDPVATNVTSVSSVTPVSITGLAAIYTANTGSVGIGKSNPAYTLDVSGSINATSILINGTPVGSGGSGSSQWTTTGANIYYSAGSVGIGTANMTCNLQIYGASSPCIGLGNSSSVLSFQIGAASFAGSYSSSAITGDSIIRALSGNLMLQTGTGAAAIYIQNSTNCVGIGTNSPPSWGQLTINGTGNNAGSSNQLVLMNSSNTNMVLMCAMSTTTGFIQSFQQGTGSAPLCLNQLGGYVGIGTASPSYPLTLKTATSSAGFIQTDGTIIVGSYVGGSATAGWYGTTSNHPLCFFTNNSTPQLTVATTGYVGIGTVSPNTYLCVGPNGGVNQTGNLPGISMTSSSGQTMAFSVGQGTSGINNLLMAWNYNATPSSGYGQISCYGGNNPLVLQSAGGNVGIGTISPSSTLHVTGTGIYTSGIRSNLYNIITTTTTLSVSQMGGMLEFGGSSAYTVTLPSPGGGSSATNGYMTFQAWINTTVAVTFSTPSGYFYGQSGNGASTMIIPNVNNQIATFASDGYNWAVWLAPSQNSSGWVGIGTSNPSIPLHVYTGNASPVLLEQSSTNPNYISFRSNGSTTAYIGLENSTGGGLFGSNAAYGLSMGTNTTGGGIVAFAVQNVIRMNVGTAATAPFVDNTYACGYSSNRWTAVYAVNGTIQTSDPNRKIMTPLPYGLAELIKVNPIKYKWKDDFVPTLSQQDIENDVLGAYQDMSSFEYYGVNAQEVHELFPELVYHENPDRDLGINYGELVPVCINAIKELHVANQELTATNITLTTSLSSLTQTVKDQANQLATLAESYNTLQSQLATVLSSIATSGIN